MPNDNWNIDTYNAVALEGDQFEEELDAAGARLYRGVAARLNYIAPDRPDIAYAVEEDRQVSVGPAPTCFRVQVSVDAIEDNYLH